MGAQFWSDSASFLPLPQDVCGPIWWLIISIWLWFVLAAPTGCMWCYLMTHNFDLTLLCPHLLFPQSVCSPIWWCTILNWLCWVLATPTESTWSRLMLAQFGSDSASFSPLRQLVRDSIWWRTISNWLCLVLTAPTGRMWSYLMMHSLDLTLLRSRRSHSLYAILFDNAQLELTLLVLTAPTESMWSRLMPERFRSDSASFSLLR